MKIRYALRAQHEMEAAYAWYELQCDGLGEKFLDCVADRINHLTDFPKICAIAYKMYRRCILNRFPFSIYYTIEPSEIVIHAVFDDRQDPQKRP